MGASALATTMALAQPTYAATNDTTANDAATTTMTSEVVVTGTLIRGTAKDTALPVEVITANQIQLQGVPDYHDLARNDPAMGPIMGEENQWSGNTYMSAGPVGASRDNLHGLGPLRTLTLFNGERLTTADYVDISLLPMTAIGRVEVLKDGASSTYGSDAVAGVVNYITRTDLNGLELQADYRYVPGDDGEYKGAINWGWADDSGDNVLVSFGYVDKSRLPALARSWAVSPITKNPTPWDAYETPGQYDVQTPSGITRLADGNSVGTCAALGGVFSYGFYQSPANLPGCNFDYMWDENLVNQEEQYQGYAEINTALGPNAKFHFEAMYSQDDTIRNTSPAFYPSNGPNGPGTAFTVPSTNPGFNTFLQQSGGAALIGTATGAVLVGGANYPLWQPFGLGENPFSGGGNQNLFQTQFARVSAGVKGDLGALDMHYDITATYSYTNYLADGDAPDAGFDILAYNLQQALNGFGRPNCTGTTPGQNGCMWFNPFSNAIAKNPLTGQTNPNYVAATANINTQLLRWLWGQGDEPDYVTNYGVIDAVLNGGTHFDLPGGQVQWAAGTQLRMSAFSLTTPDGGNVNSHPCATPGVTNCSPQVGPYIFLGAVNPVQAHDLIYAFFGQLQLPFTDTLKAQLSGRYENYGGSTGGAFTPEFSAKWQVIPNFALRASVGTSFRGPLALERTASGSTSVESLAVANYAYKAIDNIGNPKIGPEKGFNVDVGGIFQLDGFQALVDYWYYRLEDQIVRPDAEEIALQAIPTPLAGGLGLVNCSSAAASLLVFSNNSCVQGVTVGNDIQRVEDQVVNGPPVATDGLDFDVSYARGDVFGGRFSADVSATYLLQYKVDQFNLGSILVSKAYDGAGDGNFNRLPGPLPRLKALMTLDYTHGIHTLGITERFTGGYHDERTGLASCATVTPGICSPLNYNPNVSPFYATDITYRLSLPHHLQLTASVLDLFNQSPPFVLNAPSYDPSTSDPYGRTVEVSIKKLF